MRSRQTSPARAWALAAGFLGLVLVFRAHFALCIAKGESMLPGLQSGDLVLVDKLAYQTTEPKRGDIVVARVRGELIVKRIVGLAGEEIEVQQGQLRVNQQTLAEPYAVQPGALSLRRGRLLEGKVALLGDNRSVASSVSVHAVASKDQLLGRVIRSIHLSPGWLAASSDEAVRKPGQVPVSPPMMNGERIARFALEPRSRKRGAHGWRSPCDPATHPDGPRSRRALGRFPWRIEDQS
jgi:signal peptidase I